MNFFAALVIIGCAFFSGLITGGIPLKGRLHRLLQFGLMIIAWVVALLQPAELTLAILALTLSLAALAVSLWAYFRFR